MMQFEDWIDWRNICMANFWFWYTTTEVPLKVQSSSWAMRNLIAVLDCEWRIQEYDAA